ncbi:zinc chelation protein SecC [Candidatus Marinamargulisbacteria bacterium SCGC AG-343-D04]|nr:zinc chelation protein SecC [Candidatus Marinamargulisbacteria bacterium SCGC AG-343-D04]
MCCEPFILNKTRPKTAEQLMRSRFTAYSLKKIDYIHQTTQGKALEDFDMTSALYSMNNCQWTSLTILNTLLGMEFDETGFVEFIASYISDGLEYTLHERSEFANIDGHWTYIDGEQYTA